MQSEIDAVSVVWFHDRQLRERDWPVMSHCPGSSGVWESIAANHRYNGLSWREEDRAHRLDIPPSEIAAGKRLIERYNLKRNDAVESIDEALLASLSHVVCRPGARLSSETPGAMVDRLSILALKIHHMRAQAQRPDGDEEYVRVSTGELERLLAQRQDLMCCLDLLLAEARAGLAYFKLYRRFRTYDDAAPNPDLNGRTPGRERAAP
jgi:hypothetical protein